MSYRAPLLVAMSLLSACGDCPTASIAVGTKYELERDVACAAVDGCASEFMASVRVFEARTKNEVEQACSNDDAFGCFCERVDCRSVILLNTGGKTNHYDSNALHEMVHAAWASVGVETHDHPPEFKAALSRANTLLRAELGLE